MSTLIQPTGIASNGPLSTPVRRPTWKWTVEKYHRMIDAGILTPDDRVELVQGELVPRMPTKPPHRLANGLTLEALERVVPLDRWTVEKQIPITLPDGEPEPDVSVYRGKRRDYATRHPAPADVGLLVEISDTSLSFDRGEKLQTYAEAGLTRYWILNLPERCLESYWNPSGPCDRPHYESTQVYRENEDAPLVLDGMEVGRVRVGDLLPPAMP